MRAHRYQNSLAPFRRRMHIRRVVRVLRWLAVALISLVLLGGLMLWLTTRFCDRPTILITPGSVTLVDVASMRIG
jgi:hypothetical protein